MRTIIQNLFGKPTFADDEKNQQTRLIHILLLAMIGMNAIYTSLIGVFRVTHDGYVTANLLLLISQLVLLALLNRGYLRIVAYALVITLWLFITAGISWDWGVQDQFYPAYAIVILLAGWLLNSRFSLSIALLSSAMGWIYLRHNGLLDEGLWQWESLTIIFLLIALLTHLSQQMLFVTLNRLREQERALKQLNADLKYQIQTNAENEQERLYSEAQYRRLLAISPVAIIIGDREDFNVLYANAKSVEIFGAKQPRELLGDTLRRRMSPTIRRQLKEYAQAWNDNHTLKPIEYPFRGIDNELRDIEIVSIPIDFEGRPAILSALHDITARKQSEARYRLLLEKLPVAVVVAAIDTKHIIYANPSAINMLGADSIDQLLDLPFNNFVIPEYEAMSQLRIEMLETAQELPPMEYRYQRLDGVEITVEITTIRTVYQGENVFLSVFTDVTERLELQNQQFELERRRVTLEEQTKTFMMKDTFMTTISHEFRTPLTIINSSKELLERYYERMDAEGRGKHFMKINEQVDYMVSLLDDILFLSQANSGVLKFDPKFVHLEDLCATIFKEFQIEYKDDKHELVYTHTTSTDDPFFSVKEDLIRNTIHNLLDNAVKYSPLGGKVTFTLETTPEHAIIKVSDEGIGIPETFQENLYKPFQRGDNNTLVSSVGLGLAIIKQVVDAHGGTIACESVLNEGTTFTITFPTTK